MFVTCTGMACLLHFQSPMTFLEFSTLYLSIGSAAGAHSYFSTAGSRPLRALAALAGTIFWPVYLLFTAAVQRTKVSSSKRFFDEFPETDSFQENYAPRLRELETLMTSEISGEELFLFRDTLARYAGLTLAAGSSHNFTEFPLITLFGGKNHEIQAICHTRRNRNALNRHRINARTEFLNLIRGLLPASGDPGKAGAAALAFAKLLNDAEAESVIRKQLDRLPQIPRTISVPAMESSKWIKHQPT